ncbi:MAG TPA: DUF2267 domain-containing protein [Jiangellaceae bacterium]|nr:DUF2267 domain-containing protein [Jiangellaceae bacterium]
MPQKVGAFDHMVHSANAMVADIAEVFGTTDRRFGYRVLRAWLHTLRDRLTVEEAAHFAAQLPELMRGVYYDGWNPSRVPVKIGRDEFTTRFAKEASIPAEDVSWTVARVSVIMQSHFSVGQLEHALAQLPEWLRDIFAGVDMPAQRSAAGGMAPTDERLDRLEKQIAVLTDAVRALAYGMEERPDTEPDEHRTAKAARQAHELLLAGRD